MQIKTPCIRTHVMRPEVCRQTGFCQQSATATFDFELLPFFSALDRCLPFALSSWLHFHRGPDQTESCFIGFKSHWKNMPKRISNQRLAHISATERRGGVDSGGGSTATMGAGPTTTATATMSALALTAVLLLTLPSDSSAFITPGTSAALSVPQSTSFPSPSTSTTALFYVNDEEVTSSSGPTLPLTNDPYVLLGLSSRDGASPSNLSERDVKAAYRKMTRMHHPDAVCDKDSSEGERKRANDDFARINAAYEAIVNGEVGADKKGNIHVTSNEGSWEKPWYQQDVSERYQEYNNGSVNDIFERNAAKKAARQASGGMPYGGSGTRVAGGAGGGSGGSGTVGGKHSASNRQGSYHKKTTAAASGSTSPTDRYRTNANTGAGNGVSSSYSFTSSRSPPGSFKSTSSSTGNGGNNDRDIFGRNVNKRAHQRATQTGAYDSARSDLEARLESLMKKSADADQRYEMLKDELTQSRANLQHQNDVLRAEASDARAKYKVLERELKGYKSKSMQDINNRKNGGVSSNSNNGGGGQELSSKEKEMLGGKIAELRREAERAQRDRAEMEHKVAAAKKQCESLEAALKNSQYSSSSADDGGLNAAERELLESKVAELEKSVRNHLDVVQKYKKECDKLQKKQEKAAKKEAKRKEREQEGKPSRNPIFDIFQPLDRSSTQDEAKETTASTPIDVPKEQKVPSRNPILEIIQPLKKKVEGVVDDSITIKEAIVTSKEDSSTGVRKMESEERYDRFARTRSLKMPSKRDKSYETAVVTPNSSRIPTGAKARKVSASARQNEVSKKRVDAFASAVGLSTDDAQRNTEEHRAVAVTSNDADLHRRIKARLYEKKGLVIAGSVTVLVLRSLLKAWIRGGML